MAPASDPTAATSSNNDVKGFEINQLQDGGKGHRDDDFTRDGSVDRHGKPALRRNTGGWRCGIFLLVNQGLVTLAFSGVEVNMVLFAKSVLRQSNAEAANTFSRWLGTVEFFSLMGAFISDSYLGRYLTCVTFQIVHIFGLMALSISTYLFMLKPPDCGKIGQLCDPHRPIEVAVFYISIYLIALGNGAPEPALATFGADQFDEENPEEKKSKASFYSYFYVALNLGCLIGETVLVYLESMGHWVVAFWTCTASGILAFLLFLSGSFHYRHFKATGNPISRFSQVIVASIRKMNQQLPSNGEGLHETIARDGDMNGLRKIPHTNGLEFLDRAAYITQDDITWMSKEGQTANPWNLCTVTQVEEVKCVLRILPIWFCTILSSVVFIQMLSLFVEQGAAMDRKVSKSFLIPPASMTSFDIVSTTLFIVFYDKLIVPFYIKIAKREPKPPSELQRIGIGLAIAVIALVIAGFVERLRLNHASSTGETSSLSIFWQTPQYVLVGVSEAFVHIAQMEFFASQTPDGLKSLGMALSMFSSAIGSYVASMILTMVMKFTTKDGKPGWVPPNLNNGHLDRFFFLSAGLTALDLAFYVVCAKSYKFKSLEKREGRGYELMS
ncbi:protein NRT1/ PTR FAMILY 7.3-like [Argentina anserina]|uniref:protein NRT1/ PTR FAMILY 7.3-like n=1 Tax=Argentina anserina TaxID=57926 RepID=UPI0021767284|nr:protein NRT1/ PTR FAMILY 7.3-like [Potentilla anserina]